jgi:hypothetical protein
MKHLKLFENFETVKYPNSIELKLTEKWKIEKDIHNMPSKISLRNDDELYNYIGNTKLDGFTSGTDSQENVWLNSRNLGSFKINFKQKTPFTQLK